MCLGYLKLNYTYIAMLSLSFWANLFNSSLSFSSRFSRLNINKDEAALLKDKFFIFARCWISLITSSGNLKVLYIPLWFFGISGSDWIDLKNLNKLSNKSNFESLRFNSSKDLGGDFYLRGFESLQGTFYTKTIVLSNVSEMNRNFFDHFLYVEKLVMNNSTNVTFIEGIDNCTNIDYISISNSKK